MKLILLVKRLVRSILPKRIVSILYPLRCFFTQKVRYSSCFVEAVSYKKGIEIGGPSAVFRYVIPMYKRIKELDGVNYSTRTLSEGSIEAGDTFDWSFGVGRQYIAEASDLSIISDCCYDFCSFVKLLGACG